MEGLKLPEVLDFADIDILKAKEVEEVLRNIRQATYADCWHANSSESPMLWRQYGYQGAEIAIKSTVSRLKSSLNSIEDFVVGSVRYVDFDTYAMEKNSSIYSQFFLKRECFNFEKEVRAVIIDKEKSHHTIPDRWLHTDENKLIEVDLSQYIESVLISPRAPSYLVNAVVDVTNKLLTDRIDVKKSTLYDEPEG